LNSFDSTGFTVAPGSTDSTNVNANNETYVAWTWKAGHPSTPTTGAVSFDGTGDYLSIPHNADFIFGTTFTIECFFYLNSYPASGTESIFSKIASGASNQSWDVRVKTTGAITTQLSFTSPYEADSSSTVPLKKWVHYACSVNSGTVKVYLDGVEVGSGSVSGSMTDSTSTPVRIGANDSTYMDGFVSNARILKGTALYTSDFTPPTTELTNVTNTKLLCCQSPTSASVAAVKPASEDWQPSGFTYWTAGMSQNWNQSSSSTSASGDYINVALPTSGKYYWESILNDPSEFRVFGIQQGADFVAGYDDNTFGFYFNGNVGDPTAVFLTKNEDGTSRGDAITHGTSAGDAFSDGEKVMWAWDADNDKIWLGRNGTWYASGDPESGTNASISGEDLSAASWYFKIGYNNEAGATNTLTLTNVTSTSSTNFDPVANGDAAATNFNPLDAFSVNGTGYSTASAAGLTAGTITPTGASVGTKQGFSIISYTGDTTSGGETLAHGLNETPKMVHIKRRDSAYNWISIITDSSGQKKSGYLDLTNALGNDNSSWDSNVITLSSSPGVISNGGTYVAYCWAEIPGFSKFGSYTGNGSTTLGTFVETGFKPALLLVKRVAQGTAYSSWAIYDSTRSTFNTIGLSSFNFPLWANLSASEGKRGNGIDAASGAENIINFFSNGFMALGSGAELNVSGEEYIYCAWAEAPTFNLYGAQANAR
jgi:hypothetical protein